MTLSNYHYGEKVIKLVNVRGRVGRKKVIILTLQHGPVDKKSVELEILTTNDIISK